MNEKEENTIASYRAWIISQVEEKYNDAEKEYNEAYEAGDALRMFAEAERDAWEMVLRWLKELHGYDDERTQVSSPEK